MEPLSLRLAARHLLCDAPELLNHKSILIYTWGSLVLCYVRTLGTTYLNVSAAPLTLTPNNRAPTYCGACLRTTTMSLQNFHPRMEFNPCLGLLRCYLRPPSKPRNWHLPFSRPRRICPNFLPGSLTANEIYLLISYTKR